MCPTCVHIKKDSEEKSTKKKEAANVPLHEDFVSTLTWPTLIITNPIRGFTS